MSSWDCCRDYHSTYSAIEYEKGEFFIDGSTPAEDADLVPEGHSNFSWGMES